MDIEPPLLEPVMVRRLKEDLRRLGQTSPSGASSRSYAGSRRTQNPKALRRPRQRVPCRPVAIGMRRPRRLSSAAIGRGTRAESDGDRSGNPRSRRAVAYRAVRFARHVKDGDHQKRLEDATGRLAPLASVPRSRPAPKGLGSGPACKCFRWPIPFASPRKPRPGSRLQGPTDLRRRAQRRREDL